MEATDELTLPDEVNVPEVKLTLITREGWGAKKPKALIDDPMPPLTYLVMAFNTGLPGCKTEDECKVRMKELQQLHFDKGFPDMHYNFVIGQDGNIYEGRGWSKLPGPFEERPELDERGFCIGVLGDGRDPDYSHANEFITALYFAGQGQEEGYLEEDYEVCEDTQKF